MPDRVVSPGASLGIHPLGLRPTTGGTCCGVGQPHPRWPRRPALRLAGRPATAYLGMTGQMDTPVNQPREPIFNIPAVIVILLVIFGLVYGLINFVLSQEQIADLILLFAFIPARYDTSLMIDGALPGGLAADIWTFVTYGFIHADLGHFGLNGLWLLAFGTPVARRFGTARFLAFLAVAAAAGAGLHLVTNFGEPVPVIGASAAISGAMAAAARFAFQRGGPLGPLRERDDNAYRVPAASLTTMLTDRRLLTFLVVWFGANALFGIGSIGLPGDEQSVAWVAHIGGFLAGLFAFDLFDPAPITGDHQQIIDPPPQDPSLH
jgi:membrane associated rhomboid family serine protease